MVPLTEELCQPAVQVVDEVPYPLPDACPRLAEPPSLVVVEPLHVPRALELVKSVTESVDVTDVSLAKLDALSTRVVAGHECAHSWVQCNDAPCGGSLVLAPDLKGHRYAQIECIRSPLQYESRVVPEFFREWLG
eukprot:Mycagemm_TRINITY_DN10268_c0_g1::TRINITY_DN10268_c0_g1_i2::g.3952::m.3952 type:complete len:135 gc:universal TRINITY_DN10268_c0_g1_i2:470-874(+)